MKTRQFELRGNDNEERLAYEPPELIELDFADGLIVQGGSNIIDDEEHEYDPDNDD